jgi:hypothetical protein
MRAGSLRYAHEQNSDDIALEHRLAVVLPGGLQYAGSFAVEGCWRVPYVWSHTALRYVSGRAGARNGTTHTKVSRLATSAHEPATMTMARANRAPVPPERSMGRSSASWLPAAMATGQQDGRGRGAGTMRGCAVERRVRSATPRRHGVVKGGRAAGARVAVVGERVQWWLLCGAQASLAP